MVVDILEAVEGIVYGLTSFSNAEECSIWGMQFKVLSHILRQVTNCLAAMVYLPVLL